MNEEASILYLGNVSWEYNLARSKDMKTKTLSKIGLCILSDI